MLLLCPGVLLVLLSVLVLLILALSLLTVPTASLLLSPHESLQAAQERGFPGLEVSLHAAALALHHVAVSLSTGHDPAATQHPQPLVHVLTHLPNTIGNTVSLANPDKLPSKRVAELAMHIIAITHPA